VECGVWSVECGVWSVECGVWSVECGVWSVEGGVWSVEGGVWSVECGVWSVECGVWRVELGVCSLGTKGTTSVRGGVDTRAHLRESSEDSCLGPRVVVAIVVAGTYRLLRTRGGGWGRGGGS
jgi:hypothetical protein